MHKLLYLILFVGLPAWAASPNPDGYGYPTPVKITDAKDRAAFMRWFAAIAEAQYTAISRDWKPEDQDCAGLLRYAYVEALKPKTAEWFAKFPYLPERAIPAVKTLSYPMPEISRSVFRVAPGPYQKGDVEAGKLVGRTTALYLMRYNTVFLGRTPDKARRGDLLFFVHPLAVGSAYHSMVYLGNGMVVYHTGLSPEEGGEVRLLSLETLGQHPVKSWHPVPENPNFLGFFRWKILVGP